MISALAITYNEEERIEEFVKSLSFANEIIIVDSNSTDNTVSIAESLGVKVIKRDFDNFSSQKIYALTLANHEWIVFFDLDEAVSPELANEITNAVNSNNSASAYKVKRNFYFMGKHIKYSGFQNDSVVRLFRKSDCKYSDNLVHETLEVNGTTSNLKHKSDHYSYKGFDLYNEKLSNYSKLQAKMLFAKKVRPNLYHFLVRPWYRFFHQYFIKLGVLDGKEGFILAYLSAFSVFKRYLQLWSMYRKID